LGGVTATTGKDGKQTVEVEMITDLRDINSNYERFIKNLAEPRPNEKKKRDAQTKLEDYFRSFRTKVVLSWVFTNSLVIIVLSNEFLLQTIRKPFLVTQTADGSPPPGNPFLQVILV
jgi:chitin synthase